MRARVLSAAAVLAVLCTISACTSGSSGSRHTLYESFDAIAADSSAIVVGAVALQRTEGDTTISSFVVESSPTNPQLGANVDGGANPIEPGDVVEVRQMTDPWLVRGGQYALFLTPSMLSGDAASQYFVTGAEAGIYVRDGDVFRRVAADSGDTLPDTMELGE
jgi:hypothetical protein